MADENVVVVRFTEQGKAKEALDELKKLDKDDRIGLESAAIVRRTESGQLETLDEYENLGPVGMASGSLTGMLIGVLGGWVGVLLGWGAGAAVGGMFDIDRSDESDEALGVLSRAVPPGSTAVIASVEETTPEIIDTEMEMLGGEVTRRSVVDVVAELGTTHEAAEAAEREARRTVREQRKADMHEDLEQRVGKLKEKLHAS
jgi:uncharacterized membrane protein